VHNELATVCPVARTLLTVVSYAPGWPETTLTLLHVAASALIKSSRCFRMQQASLFPFALALRQPVLTVTIGAIFLLGGAGEEGLVLLGVDLVLGVTSHAERIDL